MKTAEQMDSVRLSIDFLSEPLSTPITDPWAKRAQMSSCGSPNLLPPHLSWFVLLEQ